RRKRWRSWEGSARWQPRYFHPAAAQPDRGKSGIRGLSASGSRRVCDVHFRENRCSESSAQRSAGVGELRAGERAAETGVRSNKFCERVRFFYAGHIFRSAPVAGATQVAASDFQEGEKEARSGGKAGVVLVFRESILERAWFVSCLLRHQPDAAGGGGRHYRRPVCRHFRRIVWADAAEAAIVARRFQRRRSFWQNGGHRTGGRRPGAHRLARRRRRVAKHAIAEKGGYHCSSTTPHATRVAAAQRRNPTFSLRMYLARNVSRT